jgi:hypothetical protein
MTDRGSIAPLIATYLALILLSLLGLLSIATAMLASHRVQGVADFAVLFGHDRSVIAGIPQAGKLRKQVSLFIEKAQSAKSLEITNLQTWVDDGVSNVRLCARFQDSFGLQVTSMTICRQASAKSFLIL